MVNFDHPANHSLPSTANQDACKLNHVIIISQSEVFHSLSDTFFRQWSLRRLGICQQRNKRTIRHRFEIWKRSDATKINWRIAFDLDFVWPCDLLRPHLTLNDFSSRCKALKSRGTLSKRAWTLWTRSRTSKRRIRKENKKSWVSSKCSSIWSTRNSWLDTSRNTPSKNVLGKMEKISVHQFAWSNMGPCCAHQGGKCNRNGAQQASWISIYIITRRGIQPDAIRYSDSSNGPKYPRCWSKRWKTWCDSLLEFEQTEIPIRCNAKALWRKVFHDLKMSILRKLRFVENSDLPKVSPLGKLFSSTLMKNSKRLLSLQLLLKIMAYHENRRVLPFTVNFLVKVPVQLVHRWKKNHFQTMISIVSIVILWILMGYPYTNNISTK